MNNPSNRATRLIVAIGSLLAIIFIGIPWVDEYIQLRHDASELGDLEVEFTEATYQRAMLDRIEGKLNGELQSLLDRSVEPNTREAVRDRLVEIVRRAGGRIRRLELADSESRPWALEDDDPRHDMMPTYGEESRFILHTHLVELQIDGSLQSVRETLGQIMNQGWLMTTRFLTVVPTESQESPLSLELRLVMYGLVQEDPDAQGDLAESPDSALLR